MLKKKRGNFISVATANTNSVAKAIHIIQETLNCVKPPCTQYAHNPHHPNIEPMAKENNMCCYWDIFVYRRGDML